MARFGGFNRANDDEGVSEERGEGRESVLGWGSGKAKESRALGSQCSPKVPHPHPSLFALEQLYPVERKVVNGPDSNERIAYMGVQGGRSQGAK